MTDSLKYKGDDVPGFLRRPHGRREVVVGVREAFSVESLKGKIFLSIKKALEVGTSLENALVLSRVDLPNGCSGQIVSAELRSRETVKISLRIDDDFEEINVPLVDVLLCNEALRVKLLGF